MRYLWYGSLLVAATLAAQIDLAGQHGAQLAAWTQPFPPFAITGNLYYVGSKDWRVTRYDISRATC